MTHLSCSYTIVADTLAHLRAAGRDSKECVVLWLGRRLPADATICEAYLPLQRARDDQFHIPPEGMTELMAYLRTHKRRLVAQVHSHPREAFHSLADDHWAIVRREGALSIVVPDFAAHTSPENLVTEAKFFQLSPQDRWLQVGDIVAAFEMCDAHSP